MRFIFGAALLALASVCHAQDATFILSLTNPRGAPETLILYPAEGPEKQDTRIEVASKLRRLDTAVFVGKIKPGKYRIKQAAPPGSLNPYVYVYNPSLHVASLDHQRQVFELKAGEVVDFGRWRMDSFGGTLALLMPESGPSPNRQLLGADWPSGAATVVSATQAPPTDRETSFLARSKRTRGVLVLAPTELEDGSWVSVASHGRKLVRGADGRWSSNVFAEDTRIAAYSLPAAIGIDEFGTLWNAAASGQPAQPTQLGDTPQQLACNAAGSCVVTTQSKDTIRLLGRGSEGGAWRELLSLPWKFSVWTGTSPSLSMAQRGDEVVVLHTRNQLARVDLSKMSLETQTLPFKAYALNYASGRITVGENYSDDFGRTWGKFDKRMRDGLVQIGSDGRAYATSIDIGVVASKPILRQSPDGSTGWKTIATLPVTGELRVGRRSPVMYLIENSVHPAIWVSFDKGASWAPDTALHEAIKQ